MLCPILLLLVILNGCDCENPLDKEQHKKTLYLIGAFSNLTTKELTYSSGVQEGFITVGVSSSLSVDGNTDVTLESHNSAIGWYNKEFKLLATDIKYQGLATSAFEVPSYTTTLKAGKTYTKVLFKVKTEGLECDSLYAITFEIASSSAGYEVNQKDSTPVVSLGLVNKCSGNHISKALRYELDSSNEIVASTSITIIRILKAAEENAVRFYSEQRAETAANVKKHAVALRVDAGDNVTISAWEGFDLIGGTCACDQNSKVFNVDYKYTTDGKAYQMTGTFAYQDGDVGSN